MNSKYITAEDEHYESGYDGDECPLTDDEIAFLIHLEVPMSDDGYENI